MATVDVAANVQAGADSTEPEQQLEAADVPRWFAAPGRGEVAMTVGGTVGDDDITILGNRFPFRTDGGATIPHEMPIVKSGGIRGAEEAEAFDVDGVVDEEVDAVGGEGRTEGGGIFFDWTVVISRRDELVRMGQRTHPGGEIPHFFGSAMVAEVTGVDQHIALWNRVRQAAMQPVGIAQEDEGEGLVGHGVT